MPMIGLDFETYGAANLPKVGLDNYVNHPTFQPLLAAIALGGGESRLFDLVHNKDDSLSELRHLLTEVDVRIVAHNAAFERAVLRQMGLDIPIHRFIDSAVLSRTAGAGGSLEAAASQLLGVPKLAVGKELIKLFSIPGEYQDEEMFFDPQVVLMNADRWVEFGEYCRVDANLSLGLAELLLPTTPRKEIEFSHLTMRMNEVGWKVDIPLVEEMNRRYEHNVAMAEMMFRSQTGEKELNLASVQQVQRWCEDRKVRVRSLDETHTKRLVESITRQLEQPLSEDRRKGYEEVLLLLHVRMTMGGSSLKKLQKILDTTSHDGRLRNQYLHAGAGATFRTSGRGVQMQNLKRLNGSGDSVELLFDEDEMWTNDRMAHNLRQVFTASHPEGRLIVGDFSSVESRGLAWLAGEEWKLDAYFQGVGIYESLAAKKFDVPIEQVTKPQRTYGKVGELSCGYGAGPKAVREFAAGMGVELSEAEAIGQVKDWRSHCPATVRFWYRLDDALHQMMDRRELVKVPIPHGRVVFIPIPAPLSLCEQVDGDLLSLRLVIVVDGEPFVTRVIHGLQLDGRNVTYHRASERKTGDLWVDEFTNPKTKQRQKWSLYGGKLAGLLTQSLCREIFMRVLDDAAIWFEQYDNVQLVGQFHDEIVLDWVPDEGNGATLEQVSGWMERLMSTSPLPGFPLTAEVKSDYRYTK